MPSGLYDADGKIRLTPSPGSGFCGLYAPDGSMYFTMAPGSGFCGSTAPDGSLYIVDATGSSTVGVYAPNGAIRVTTGSDNNGAWKASGVIAVWSAPAAFPSALLSISRGSNGTYFNSSGVLSTAGNNTARIDYDPNTLAVKGLLIEEQRINYCPYSSALSSWTVTNGTPSHNSNATLDPSGLNTSSLISPTGGTITSFAPPAFAATGSTVYVGSFFVKSAGAGFAQIGFYDSTNSLLYTAGYNLSTGANTSATGGITPLTSVNIGNGWWRLSASWTSAANTALIIPVVYPKSTGGGAAPAASDKIYVWGPQYEKGLAASSYIANPSTGSTTRNADVIQLIGPALAAIQGASFSIIGEAQTAVAPTTNAVLFGANGGVALVYAASVNGNVSFYDGTSLVTAAAAGGGKTWSTLAKAGLGVSGSTASLVMTGGTVGTGTHALPARTTVYLGSYSGGSFLNGWVKSFAITNIRYTDAVLQTKSV